MLTILGRNYRYCDGATRRSFLQIGGLAAGGLTLPALLREETKAATGASHKSVIMVYLSGGLAHQDTFDLKPAAPTEIRGEFNSNRHNRPRNRLRRNYCPNSPGSQTSAAWFDRSSDSGTSTQAFKA